MYAMLDTKYVEKNINIIFDIEKKQFGEKQTILLC